MLNNRTKSLVGITLVAAFLFMALSPGLTTAAYEFPSDICVGPYVDKIVYQVIADQDQRILALQAGTIEMDNSFFQSTYLPQLEADPDITVFQALRNGYAHFTINCRDGAGGALADPAFRRAFAYAFDKTAITAQIMAGYSQEHDSLVPYPNPFCIEDELPWHYYTGDIVTGNATLDAAGYIDADGDGWREFPGGAEIPTIVFEYASSVEQVGGGSCQIGVNAFRAMGIQATRTPADFNEYISRLDHHGDYDIVFFALNFYGTDVSWLAYTYWSEYADVDYQNPTNFANATYDSYRDALLYSTTFEDVYAAAAEMQKILFYQCPRIVVYENIYFQGYRNDKFQGHVPDFGRYITGPWTMRKINLIDADFGGTVTVALGQEPDSFNIYTTNSAYSAAVLENQWPSLYSLAPDGTPWPDLAESLLTETNSDNPAIPVGHTRFTIDIIQNATWSDGTPLTAEDVAYTYTYILESGVYGNPAAAVGLGDLVGAYSPTTYRAVIEFGTESYWHFNNFAYSTIIPKHIFQTIGYENWNVWNPGFDPEDPNVNCGPFILTDLEQGEFYEVTFNPLFHYAPERPTQTTTTTTTGTGTTTTTTTGTVPTFDATLAIVAGAVGAAVVILVGGFVLLRQK